MKSAVAAPLAMSKLPTFKLLITTRSISVVLLIIPTTCKVPLLSTAVMFEALYAVPLSLNEILLLAFGGLLELFLQELNANANKVRAKNAHFIVFMMLDFLCNILKYYILLTYKKYFYWLAVLRRPSFLNAHGIFTDYADQK